jgi:hypothetical protein
MEDLHLLHDLLAWIHQLGKCPDHDAMIVADAGTPASHILGVKSLAEGIFRSARIVTNAEPVKGWIAGANSLFLTAAEEASKGDQPWLFLEPDSVPLCPGWLDTLEIHYRVKGKPYMGACVPCDKPGLPPRHMPGVSIYHPGAYAQLSPIIQNAPALAFDMSIAATTVEFMAESELFQHLWGEFNNPPRFNQRGQPSSGVFTLGYLNPKAVLFHRNKDGSLIRLLRGRFGVTQSTFIQLGKLGDIISLLPGLHWLYRQSGLKPRLIVSNEFASVLDGVSYVESVPLKLHWWSGMHNAIAYAKTMFGGATVIQCYAHDFSNPGNNDYPCFMQSAHHRMGIHQELLTGLPLVFDRRNPERELRYVPFSDGKPFIAINTNGQSSPFPHSKLLYDSLHAIKDKLHVVNLNDLRMPRIYDMLGLLDHSSGSIHIDTATLHLAAGSSSPYIALTRGGWASSIPRGNCCLQMTYDQYSKRSQDVVGQIQQWL